MTLYPEPFLAGGRLQGWATFNHALTKGWATENAFMIDLILPAHPLYFMTSGRLKAIEKFQLTTLTVVMVAYERWSLTK